MKVLKISLAGLEQGGSVHNGGVERKGRTKRQSPREFHIAREIRDQYTIDENLFSLRGDVILANFRQVRELAAKINANLPPDKQIRAGELNAMGLIDEILHYVTDLYRKETKTGIFDTTLKRFEEKFGAENTDRLLRVFSERFPPMIVYKGGQKLDDYLSETASGESSRSLCMEELMLLALANLNPAFAPFQFLFDDAELRDRTCYLAAVEELKAHFAELPPFGPDDQNLWDMLRSPVLASPDSLTGQLDYIRRRWGLFIEPLLKRLLTSLDVIREEEKPSFSGPGPAQVLSFSGLEFEYERFSQDQEWMPKTVLMAKSTLVWLFQLSQKYGREIKRLDEIPDEELDELSGRGFTGLWLIGLWERSNASRTIKQWTGNPEAAASAYSLYDYDIAGELGGWGALVNLRERCARRGIRLGSDMVPNHTGIDSRWLMEHPGRFLQLSHAPFPSYTFNSGNLSGREGITVQIEDHYYTRDDAAVVFKRIDHHSGDVRYIYHGNDGTSMPWNDTAQIDFLNPEAREAVIRTIIGVCRQFSIVRFDAAMTLAKRHIQRLWYPEPGRGGDIASRAEHAISAEEFNRRIPNEFWREVVDRCAAEAPYTLLLAEAFWMMEGYFVRTLGMHRVYNSAFMNMLKNEENAKYRMTIKNTLEFDPEILKRFVNFMNNPDEETAAAQFGKGDKYFGICTLLVTMPGLPMFGHGQIEGFEEKYGMEYRRAYRDEKPDSNLADRHEREIFPLLKKRYLFSGSADFTLYDFFANNGAVNENVFAYSNRAGGERALVLYNNSYSEASGWIRRESVPVPQKDGSARQQDLFQALGLRADGACFVLFREQRSGLWYIRSSKELAERGLFAALKGYEAQVFLDIHEEEDAPDAVPGLWTARWATLNHALDGRGVPDIDAALADLFLADLYKPFMEFFEGERMETLYRCFAAKDGGRNIPAAALGEIFREPALAFVKAVRIFLDGAGGRYDPWPQKRDGFDVPKIDGSKKILRQPEAMANDFEEWLARFVKLASHPYAPHNNAPDNDAPHSAAGKTKKAGADKFLGEMADFVREKPFAAAFVLGYGALKLLKEAAGEEGGRKLAEYWRLDQKLIDVWQGLGVSGDEAWKVAELSKVFLDRTDPSSLSALEKPAAAAKKSPAAKKSAKETALSLILDNYASDDFRRLLGINTFENTTWFNKEAFETLLFYGTLLALPEKTSCSWPEWTGLLAEIKTILTKAETASNYKLDNLIDELSENGKPEVKENGE